ncbi:hypothetical protein MPL3356_340147 [Mesorhizobium plurifarium]|uniref:Uncharacterized protein n=1 Tax=Mesorhizobium plurifarium TaxID=69974 RepID=A0A090E1R7_MESPL|nr:hypothetical protein MPL3356_340147 [Mesorhizobium plurifarium]
MSIAAVNASSTRSFAQLLATGDYHAPDFISVLLGTGAVQIQASHPEVDLPDTDLVNLNFRDILFWVRRPELLARRPDKDFVHVWKKRRGA